MPVTEGTDRLRIRQAEGWPINNNKSTDREGRTVLEEEISPQEKAWHRMGGATQGLTTSSNSINN